MKKIVIAAAFVIAALQATALPEITLPDLKDCAYGVPVGTLGQFRLGADIEEFFKRYGPEGYEVIFDGDRCILNPGGIGKISNIWLTMKDKKGVTIAKAKEKILRWAELLERKYGIKMESSTEVTDRKLKIRFFYGDAGNVINIWGEADIDGNFSLRLNSSMSTFVINR